MGIWGGWGSFGAKSEDFGVRRWHNFRTLCDYNKRVGLGEWAGPAPEGAGPAPEGKG